MFVFDPFELNYAAHTAENIFSCHQTVPVFLSSFMPFCTALTTPLSLNQIAASWGTRQMFLTLMELHQRER